jgi:hypothetical protein
MLKSKETPALPSFVENIYCEEQEKEILYYLLKHGAEVFYTIPSIEDPDNESLMQPVTVGQHIISEIMNDNLEFKNLVYKKVFDEYIRFMASGTPIESRTFTNHPDSQISQFAVNLLASRHKLSKIWSKHHAEPVDEVQALHSAVPKTILVYKSKVMQMVTRKLHDELKRLNLTEQVLEVNEILGRINTINNLKNIISKELDRIVL